MLQIRPSCENCDTFLPADSLDARICTYECTFCEDCVTNILHNVCPNCGGGFEKRPIRPKKELNNNPATVVKVFKPVVPEKFKIVLEEFKHITPENR
ncbi:hypothetical protein CLV91_0889 [Maribacter vaceletii]|uniref:DUF1272 domain-containing protein n=1 Tax=Maribacter vaceletii TaxID=1206816 RepID=A0A495ED36_9FLAO|nr:DUF1272 domain-containing protein [Maribacter vaceletii]RKR14810.1 hypothetical protein CLV91_0889 [Maribacter vaceletii]